MNQLQSQMQLWPCQVFAGIFSPLSSEKLLSDTVLLLSFLRPATSFVPLLSIFLRTDCTPCKPLADGFTLLAILCLQNYCSRPFQKSLSLFHWKQSKKKKCGVTQCFAKMICQENRCFSSVNL